MKFKSLMQSCGGFGFALLAAGSLLTTTAMAQRGGQWRISRLSDGYAATVSVSPRGNVWVKQGDTPEITMFDGYHSRRTAAPEATNFRVYESRTGQIWSLSLDGLLVTDRGQWTRHPINEIRVEMQTNALTQLRQISLIPAEINHVFFLLSDRLMEYDAVSRKASLVKVASQTRLGKFTEMQEARDGSVWIAGMNGLARIEGPIRHLNAESIWVEHIADAAMHLQAFQRPFDDPAGEITTVAVNTAEENARVVVHFDGSRWAARAIPGEKPRQAWRAWDKSIWAYSFTALLRVEGLGLPTRESMFGLQHDVAIEPSGAFWLATSEGVVRYAPALWRTPAELENLENPVHAILPESGGDVPHCWIGTPDALVELKNGAAVPRAWPEDFDVRFHPAGQMFRLRDGQIAISGVTGSLLYNPATSQFRAISHPQARRTRFAGQFSDGLLCAWSVDSTPPARVVLEKFDGIEFTPFLENPAEGRLGTEIYFMKQAQNGDLWLGSATGAGLMRHGEKQVEFFGAAKGFIGDRASSLVEFSDGRIWCAGHDKILQYDGRKWDLVRSRLDRIHGMVRSRDGRVWVATNNGLLRYYGGSWLINDLREGLPSSTVYSLAEDSGGGIWAGSSRGIGRFYPEADTDPPQTFTPVLETPDEAAPPRITTLRFRGSDKWQYTAAADLVFSYRVDEGAWSPYTNSSVRSLPNLGAGQHSVDVKCMDRNWNEDPHPATLEFEVVLPFYQDPRLLAVSVCGLLVILFFAGLAINKHLQLVRSYAEVERIVAQRTRELERANQELLHSQKMRALGTLAAGIAHDFNNILSVIKGSAQIIEANPGDPDKIQTRVQRIMLVVEQGAGIVRAMLGLGRVTDKALVDCLPNDLLEESLRLLGDHFPPGVQIRLEKGERVPKILCSPELIHQMLLNLILNAVDAIGGQGVIWLRTEVRSDIPETGVVLAPAAAPAYVKISVQDHGSGVTPEVLPRIFEPFYTTKSLSSRRGTGLGLSMVYELAKSIGYGLHVESVMGAGSTFSILMPVA